MGAKTYDPDNVVITFANQPIKGFADGSFLVIEPTKEAFTVVEGADGEVVRTKTSSKIDSIRIVLMSTSDSNDVLSAIHELDKQAPNGAGIAPFGVADLSGRFLYAAPEAWIEKAPTADFGREAGPREWVLKGVDAQRFDGGS